MRAILFVHLSLSISLASARIYTFVHVERTYKGANLQARSQVRLEGKKMPRLSRPLRPDTRALAVARGVGVRNCEISIKFASKTRNVRGVAGRCYEVQSGEGDMSIVSGN